jgi:hypothetical protein
MPRRCVPKKDVAELRKAGGSRERAVILRSPNGATHPACAGYRPSRTEGTGGTETSQYPEEKKVFP